MTENSGDSPPQGAGTSCMPSFIDVCDAIPDSARGLCRQKQRERFVDRATQMLLVQFMIGVAGRDRPSEGFGKFRSGT